MEEKCCKKCGSSNINFQTVNEVKLKDKHHNFLWWITIGWIWVPIKWLFFTLPALLIKIFSHKKTKAKYSCHLWNLPRLWISLES